MKKLIVNRKKQLKKMISDSNCNYGQNHLFKYISEIHNKCQFFYTNINRQLSGLVDIADKLPSDVDKSYFTEIKKDTKNEVTDKQL